jgi:hypothetical protein
LIEGATPEVSVSGEEITLNVGEVKENKSITLTVKYKDSKMTQFEEKTIVIDIIYEGAGVAGVKNDASTVKDGVQNSSSN